MNFQRCLARGLGVVLGAAVLAGTGCSNLFVPKHKVLVDAISVPDVPKPSGMSYRLLAKRSVVNQTPAEVSVIKACVDAALSSVGLFEAPPNAPSDLFIEVSYGQDTTPRVDPAARETFLQLSARENPDGAMDRPTGREIWDVRVAVLGVAGRLETAMPLLCSVAASYMATNTLAETKIEIPQNSPDVVAIREQALRALRSKSPPSPPPPAPPPTQPAKS